MTDFEGTIHSPSSISASDDHEESVAFNDGVDDYAERFPFLTEGFAQRFDDGDHLTPNLMWPPGTSSSTNSIQRKAIMGEGFRRRRKNEFPPYLSTLDKSGRPRYNLRKVRSDGRLEIAMDVNDKPGIIRSSGKNGELRIDMIKWEQLELNYNEQSQRP